MNARSDAVLALLAAVLVTWWARRIVPRLRFEHVGYAHASTVAAVGWSGVPVHHHDDDKALAREPHVAMYAER